MLVRVHARTAPVQLLTLLLLSLSVCVLFSQPPSCMASGVNNAFKVMESFESPNPSDLYVVSGSVTSADCSGYVVPQGNSALYMDGPVLPRTVSTNLGEYTGKVNWFFVANMVNCSDNPVATSLDLSYFDTDTSSMVYTTGVATMSSEPTLFTVSVDVPVMSSEDGTFLELSQDSSMLMSPSNESTWLMDSLVVVCNNFAWNRDTDETLVTITSSGNSGSLTLLQGGVWNTPDNGCPSGSSDAAMKMYLSGVRIVETIDFDISGGALLSFEFWASSDGSACADATCGSICDSDAYILVQFSVDGGTTWTTFHGFNGDGFAGFPERFLRVPPSAFTASTRFRFIQEGGVQNAAENAWTVDYIRLTRSNPLASSAGYALQLVSPNPGSTPWGRIDLYREDLFPTAAKVSAFTVELWFRPTATNTGSLLVLFDSGAFNLQYMNSESVRLGSTQPQQSTGSGTFDININHHIAVTYDGANIRLYKNGALLLTKAETAMPNTATPGRIVVASGSLLTGEIDELRFWNVVRTEAEINQYYQYALPYEYACANSDKLAYYQLNEGSCGRVQSVVPYGNGGLITNDAVFVRSRAPVGDVA
eukprot:CAMPEP_0174231954 /NCGR_PEP_ID=MMETSP0417-20130205/2349_1 /TAXON_ID=242541 /ORGANISM="Mayorella sp, Strain BSH-02190019" /LENGTH=591 /DNA_ID=CAMNT_0015309925 /DNA_START=160 /DNA_END=1931 /DNA_ORIENTATION=+